MKERERGDESGLDALPPGNRGPANVVSGGMLTLCGLTSDPAGLVHVSEPAGVSPDVISGQLLAGAYDKPFIVDEANCRALCFTMDGCIQSEMRLDDPDTLVSEYTRKMMAFLLFCPQPSRILMIGLGGGSLVKYCYRHLPASRMTVVEIDQHVIGMRTAFQVPADDARLNVVHDDGARYVAEMSATAEQRIDVVLIDAYDRAGIAPSVIEPRFLDNVRRVLTDRGVFVMNLAADATDLATLLGRIQCAFGEPVMPVRVGSSIGNTVAFAGPAMGDVERLAAVSSCARRIRDDLDLDFRKLPTLVNDYLSRTRAMRVAACVRSP